VTPAFVLRAAAPGPIALNGNWVALPQASPLWSYFSSSGGDAHLTAVARSADVAVALNLAAPRHLVGVPFLVHVRLTDRGPDASTRTAVTFALHGLKLLAISGPGVSCKTASARCTLTGIPAGITIVTLTVLATSAGTKTVGATATGTATDPVLNNNRTHLIIRIPPRRR
jgi:uncharacterized protein DUF11